MESYIALKYWGCFKWIPRRRLSSYFLPKIRDFWTKIKKNWHWRT